MIISLLTNIIELLVIVYLLWLLFEQNEMLNEIEYIAKTHNMLCCAEFEADCENCKDKITDNGKTCMRKGMKEIEKIVGEYYE